MLAFLLRMSRRQLKRNEEGTIINLPKFQVLLMIFELEKWHIMILPSLCAKMPGFIGTLINLHQKDFNCQNKLSTHRWFDSFRHSQPDNLLFIKRNWPVAGHFILQSQKSVVRWCCCCFLAPRKYIVKETFNCRMKSKQLSVFSTK